MNDSKACAKTAGFPACARVRTKKDYASVFEHGRSRAHPLFVLRMLRAEHSSHLCRPRLGLAVSRKVDSRAVGRNRIKRVLRERFRHLAGQLIVADYVVVARPAAKTAANQTLRDALDLVLQQSGALPRSILIGTMRAPTN